MKLFATNTILTLLLCLTTPSYGYKRNTSFVSLEGKKVVHSRPSLTVQGGSSGNNNSNYKLSEIDLAISGIVASIVGVSAMHPIDVIKVLQQSSAGHGLSMPQAFASILSQRGPFGFYRGIGPAIFTESSAAVMKFPVYEGLKAAMAKYVPVQYHGSGLFVCAIAAAIAASFTTVPGEIVKQRLMMSTSVNSATELVKLIFKQDGIIGFYAGYAACCLRDIPFTVFQLAFYDIIKQIMLVLKKKGSLNQSEDVICAALTGGLTGFLTAPMDLLKTKIMVEGHLYSGFWDCVSKTIAPENGGMLALLNGAGARVAWLTPFCAIYLPVYDIMKKQLIARGNEKM